MSSDLHEANQTQKSSTSNEWNSSLLQHPRFADKVRQVSFQDGQMTPDNNSRKQDQTSSKEHGDENNLSPYHEKVANRRSCSFTREPRSPSWNDANFNSSAMSSNTADEPKSAGDLSEKDPSQLNLSILAPNEVINNRLNLTARLGLIE